MVIWSISFDHDHGRNFLHNRGQMVKILTMVKLFDHMVDHMVDHEPNSMVDHGPNSRVSWSWSVPYPPLVYNEGTGEIINA